MVAPCYFRYSCLEFQGGSLYYKSLSGIVGQDGRGIKSKLSWRQKGSYKVEIRFLMKRLRGYEVCRRIYGYIVWLWLKEDRRFTRELKL
ncbi:hypothetical protein HanRHA438_Chr04g0158371 [Helianthus annuus]|nr:hypothetical protein HanHA89_Chr04g0134421 [Helianthus annuus]KAJ0756351.1 hypothetical protein HanLR1_Chr04g0126181 [Helianthus annuus]KAJ0925317.1 hypothetical protein HanRHA438_Chr04g0158371 [Helianthus annuus]